MSDVQPDMQNKEWFSNYSVQISWIHGCNNTLVPWVSQMYDE